MRGDLWTKLGTESKSGVSRLNALPFKGLLLTRLRKGSWIHMAQWSDWSHFPWSWIQDTWTCGSVAGQILVSLLRFWERPSPFIAVKTTCAWAPMPGRPPVRHPCASRAGLPQLLSQAHMLYIAPDPLEALESCWKSCKISTVISARADTSAVTLYLARSHEICSDIFLLARESWPFLRVRCPALELLFLCSWSWHCFVGYQCS